MKTWGVVATPCLALKASTSSRDVEHSLIVRPPTIVEHALGKQPERADVIGKGHPV